MLIDCPGQWRESGIINEQPFRILTKPLLNFGKMFCSVLGVLQLVFMATFASVYTPDWTHCASSPCDVNGTSSWRTGAPEYPSWLWLVWPSTLLLYYGYMYSAHVLSLLPHVLKLLYGRCVGLLKCFSKFQNLRTQSADLQLIHLQTTLLRETIHILPACGFPVALFMWFHAHRSWESDEQYYQVTSIVFLLGWITTFIFFCGISKNFYIFSVILVEILAIDIINGFMSVFLFTLVAFSSSLYVLRGPVRNNTLHDPRELNFYEVFASGLGMSDYIEYTIDDHRRGRFFRLVTW